MMQQLAAELASSLLTTGTSDTTSAQAWSALLPPGTSIRVATLVTRDVLAITGNLAVPGSTNLSLLPSTSAAGRCALNAAPVLVEGHCASSRSLLRGSAAACRSLCKSALYVPIIDEPSISGNGNAAASGACGSLVIAFRCSQHAALLRNTPQLAQLAAALAAALPPAISSLQQVLPGILSQPADTAAVGSLTHTNSSQTGAGGSDRDAAVLSGSLSACGAGSVDAGNEMSGGSSERARASPNRKAASTDGSLKVCGCGPAQQNSKAARQADARQHAVLADAADSCLNPFWLQYGSVQREAEFAAWYAEQTWQWDMCVFVVCLASLVARLLQPSEHAFQVFPTASGIAATAALAALTTATFCHKWYLARRELLCMVVWGAMAHLALTLADAVPQWTPLWAARLLALEIALLFPLCFRVRFVYALPITALKCLTSLSLVPQVLGCSAEASAPMPLSVTFAQIFLVLVFLVAPSMARHRLERRLRKQFEAHQVRAASSNAAPMPVLVDW